MNDDRRRVVFKWLGGITRAMPLLRKDSAQINWVCGIKYPQERQCRQVRFLRNKVKMSVCESRCKSPASQTFDHVAGRADDQVFDPRSPGAGEVGEIHRPAPFVAPFLEDSF